MRDRAASVACVWTLIAALAGCKKSEGVACDPPVNPTCPGVSPSFANDVYPNVFVPFCVSCHSSIGVEPGMPFTTYQQIYGQAGAEAQEIFNQVFEDCLMPPLNAPAQLTDSDAGADADAGGALGARQTLLDWLSCGAQNN
jgi:hypothetical protein